jgi:thiol-disulfide isomerase/thioredoxin
MRRIMIIAIMALFLSLWLRPIFAAPASYNQAVKDYNAGKYAVALAEFESCKTAFPTNALVRYYTALCEQNLGRLDQAKSEFQWVAGNGDARLRSMAQAGLNQLSRAHATGSHSITGGFSSGTASAPSGSSQAKVRRVLDFYADWCGPCRAFGPVFDEVKSRMRDISFERYNVDDDSTNEIRSKCPAFSSIPHVVFMDGGGKVLYHGTPPSSAESFEREISQYR